MELIIFDFDGVFVEWTKEWRNFYSGTLEKTVREERGKNGIETLKRCRKNFEGKGEIALFLLRIPFKKWAEKLNEVPLDLIEPNPRLVEKLRRLKSKKVIYSGSPRAMILKVLQKIGFSSKDFDLIIGWQEPEIFPIKWTCSPLMFEMICKIFSVSPQRAWAVGDDFDSDLKPAQEIGMKTVGIGNCKGELNFKNLEDFLEFMGGEEE